MRPTRPRAIGRTLGGLALVGALTSGACALNPVTGDRELVLVSESQEIAMGREGSAAVIDNVGLHPDADLQAYVNRLGQSLASGTERSQLAWEFHVLDDATPNAFALPGGFIFVTRGLLTGMTNEAELVSVLGHEAGHVTARHSVSQMTRQQVAALGLGIGSILSPTIAEYGQVAGAGLGLLFLKYGRDDEIEADHLGFRYALAEGYDTREMIGVFRMLERGAELRGGGRLPEWQSSHPDPGTRIQDIEGLVNASAVDFGSRTVGRDAFLAHLDGMVYGEDPRAGYFQEGTLFVHPELEFVLRYPDGWRTQNTLHAVVGVSPEQDALIGLRAARGSAVEAAREFVGQDGLQARTPARGTVHGNPAITVDFTAPTEGGGSVRGIAAFIEHGGATWAITAYSTAERFSTYHTTFQQTIGSFERLTDPTALAAQPLRVQIASVPRRMSLKAFDEVVPSSIPLAELAVINGLEVDEELRAGQTVKRVVGAPPPRVTLRR